MLSHLHAHHAFAEGMRYGGNSITNGLTSPLARVSEIIMRTKALLSPIKYTKRIFPGTVFKNAEISKVYTGSSATTKTTQLGWLLICLYHF